MILPHTYAAGRLAEVRMRDGMREGEHARLMPMARPARFGPVEPILASVGGLLVSAGQQLQARPAPHQRDPKRSHCSTGSNEVPSD
jgi:hypothetical protein